MGGWDGWGGWDGGNGGDRRMRWGEGMEGINF